MNAKSQGTVRIIGGRLRAKKIAYSGDQRTRPMKDRVREALFNLIGPQVKGKFALDFFAGTGAIAFEAISRGATGGLLFECHLPTVKIIHQNCESLALNEKVETILGDVFYWAFQTELPANDPWIAFLAPPYSFFHQRINEVQTLVHLFDEKAPKGSLLVVESDIDFDLANWLPKIDEPRIYPPAKVGILHKS
ncbi:MAG: RsmD family RNA methyltransferase [Pirellulaceae bacterium]|nr:RsmD family RNA methyltransferase [Pirellulaceae bacterium]